MTHSASLVDGEAALRFPYDERHLVLLRALPGRRWDREARVWRVPLDPESAHSLTLLFGSIPEPVQLSPALARAIERRRSRRRRGECLVDVSRPDRDWWLSFPTDAGAAAERLLEHPQAFRLPPIGRGLIPPDAAAAALIAELSDRAAPLRLTEPARVLLTGQAPPERTGASVAVPERSHDVTLGRDSRSGRYALIAAEHATLARAATQRAGLRALDGPRRSLALALHERDAAAIAALLDELELDTVDPRVREWLDEATRWRGTVEVDGCFLLLGDVARLPGELREHGASIPGGVSLPLTLETWRALEPLAPFHLGRAARRCVDALEAGRPAPPAVLEGSAVHEDATFVLAPGHEPDLTEAFAALPGALPPPRGAGQGEHGALPAIRADPFCVPQLDAFLDEHEVWVAPEALELLQEVREQHARGAGLVALSAATDAELDLPRLGGELMPFQRAGVAYLRSQRRAFLADEQGLGKTIQALATLEADGAFPAVVVCPASLKLGWRRELAHWLPQRTVRVLSGTAAGPIPSADVTIVNYDIVAARLNALRALAPRALILDESHYCKNAGAKRTQAVAQLAQSLGREDLVLALTGTPVMNRPPELIAQLRILGRLSDFGSGAQFGSRFRGADAHLRLHWHLRSRCFARRLKREVLPQLPAKTRSVIPVELDNEAEYRLAERDVLAWLRSQPLDLRELDARVAAAVRAERLVRLNALKLLAARGKLHAALGWIHDFLSSGEPLVVFARHREIQRAVLERFPDALHLLGEDSARARDEAVQAFQQDAGAPPLIVCSIEVAGQGLTLTRASNVAFLELDWTPAKHDQAEDRCHRIGQQDAVTAWYLLAADTIDEAIAELLERKRAVIGAVTDGREEGEGAVIDALVRELRGEPYRRLRAVA
ncbi:MAG TPA: DEAD/DEAH box helicase [Solirubrobacteraceae bacterium]|nr:DEAD/DEAH box helicase [Solirubrobacteraceae bacterium]